MKKLALTLAASALALVAVFATTAPAGDNQSGFKTSTPAMLTGAPGVSATPIITVGDTLPGGYRFESIPDGISIGKTNGNGTVDIFVNHETSLVPFPLPSPTVAGRSDFLNSIVSKLRLNQHSAGVLKGDYAIPSSANYQRFCSNFIVTKEHGFDRDLLLTNEEARDHVNRTGTAWPPGPGAEQPGVVVALDVKSGAFRSIYGMGRHNHENTVGIPGYGHPVLLSGDDTFVSNPPESQLYLYVADDGDAVWNDEGTLHAFVADGKTSYYDVVAGEDVSGHFIEVPEPIASGKRPDGSDITRAVDFPSYAAPPPGVPDGPQWILDQWGNAANTTFGENVFDFVRIEDIAYDRTDPNVVYLADSGRGSGAIRPNGRIWKMVLDPDDPTEVESLSILIEGSDLTGQVGDIHQPDNLETTERSLLIQEDPSTANQFATPARIWRYDLASGTKEVVATINAIGPSPNPGSWESSGIVDASSVFGPGAFLVDVQAHGWEIERSPEPPVVNQVNFMREAGQLLLLRIPGE
jgi:hypothetical protein